MNRPRTSWQAYNEEMQAENERQKEALRKFKLRQAEPRPLTMNQRAAIGLAWFITKCLIAFVAVGGFIWLMFSS